MARCNVLTYGFLCMLALQVTSADFKDHTVRHGSSYYHAPTQILANECGDVRLRDRSNVLLKVFLHNYCSYSTIYDRDYPQLNGALDDLLRDADRYFDWRLYIQFVIGFDSNLVNKQCELKGDYINGHYHNCKAGDFNFESAADHTIELHISVEPATSLSAKIQSHILASENKAVAHISLCFSYHDKTCIDFSNHLRAPALERSTTIISTGKNPNFAAIFQRVMSNIACNGSYFGARPVEYMDQEKAKCACQCPVGSNFVVESPGSMKCVKTPNQQHKGTCSWTGKCFKTAVTRENCEANTCLIKNVFDKTVGVPCPWDNYVAGRNNGNIRTNDDAPRIRLQLLNPRGVVEQKNDFDWVYFMQHQKEILNQLEFRYQGLFTVRLEATDWSFSVDCEARINVIDEYLPRENEKKPCPRAINRWKKELAETDGAIGKTVEWPIYTLENFKSVSEIMRKHDHHVASREDDACGPAVNDCDSHTGSVRYFNSDGEYFDAPNQIVSWNMAPEDHNYLIKIQDSLLHEIPAAPQLKCWQRGIEFCEKRDIFNCGESSTTECLLGSKCGIHQCLEAVGENLYEAKLATSKEARETTKNVTSGFPPEFAVDPTREIHFSVKENVVGLEPGEGNIQVDISKLFELQRGVTEVGKHAGFHELEGKPIDLNKIITCRYKLENQADVWHELISTGDNIVKFHHDQTNIIFQCWTNLGKVLQEFFTVVVHPHAVLDVCGEFSRTSFYQTLKNPESDDENQYCNVPGSDFAEITFEFTYMVGQKAHDGHKIQYNFQGMRCDLFYTDGPEERRLGEPALLLMTEEPKFETIKRYAIDLIKEPTEAHTSVEFRCMMSYLSPQGAIEHPVCSHYIDLVDCDPPEFENDICKCAQDCTANKVRPYGSCGGNRIALKRGAGAILSNDELECCHECDTDSKAFECFGLTGENVPYEQDIGRCEEGTTVSDTSATLLMKAIASPSYIALIGAGVCLVFFSIGFRKRNSCEDSLNPSGYRPLL